MRTLIIVDLEATCWPPGDKRRKKQRDLSEIIEIYALKMCTEGERSSVDYHRYVKPVHNTILSEFCISLTGISQQQVDQSGEITEMISTFAKWMNLESVSPYIASWGVMDHILLSEAWASHMHSSVPWLHIDIQKIFEDFCRSHRAEHTKWFQDSGMNRISGLSLNRALHSIGGRFTGSAHSAKVDTLAALDCLRFALTMDHFTPLETRVLEIVEKENKEGRAGYWGERFRRDFTHHREFMKTIQGLVKRGVITKEPITGALWKKYTWFD